MVQVVHKFEIPKDIICYKAVRNKGTLVLCDDLGEKGF